MKSPQAAAHATQGRADEGAVDVDEPTDPGVPRQTAHPDEPCPCGSDGHAPLRIGEKLSPSGACIGGVYVCPSTSASGLRGTL